MVHMLALAEREKIIVEEFSFSQPLMGVYMHQPFFPPLIGLSKYIGSEPERRCIMAEELGHHFTTIGDQLPREFFHQCTRLNINKAEYKALRWAALYLIPVDNLYAALNEGIAHYWELAEYFNVTEDIIRFRIRLLPMHKYNFIDAAKNTA